MKASEAVEEEASEAVEEEASEAVEEEASDAVANEVEEDGGEEEVVSEAAEAEEESSNEYPVLGELTEDGLNELNCEELREICKREELRTRGRKAELVERIIKKRDALA